MRYEDGRQYFSTGDGGSVRDVYRRMFFKYLVKKYLKSCETVIDIGSGRGLFYEEAVMLEKKVLGIDLDKKHIRDNIILKDFRDIKEEYDCFFSSQLLEHINQFEFMSKAQKYCKKVLIILTERPTVRFWDSPAHIRPYTKRALKWLLENYGFKVVWLRNLYPSRAVIVVGVKK